MMETEKLILDGKQVADRMKENLAARITALLDNGIVPCLATVLVGGNPSSQTYVKMKGNACKRLGMRSIRIDLPHDTTTAELISKIQRLNNDP